MPFCDSRGVASSARATMPPVQTFGCPLRHCGQVPQKPDRHATTWSPGRTEVTSAPTASTIPAPSCPNTNGRSSGKRPLPSTTCRSLWQTPVAIVRTSTSRPHGLSMSTVSTVSGSCTLRNTAALICMWPSLPSDRAQSTPAANRLQKRPGGLVQVGWWICPCTRSPTRRRARRKLRGHRAKDAPPPLEGGGWGEGFVPHGTPPPNPLPQGEGEPVSCEARSDAAISRLESGTGPPASLSGQE